MKKTLIALAAVAVTSTAFAQVTISGRLDLGTSNVTTTERDDGAFDGQSDVSTLANRRNAYTTGRITFAGTEDLGGGLKAGFNIESTIDGGTIGNRNSFVSLSSDSWGSIQIGRYLNGFSAVRDSHYSVAGAPGGAFLPMHIGLTNGNDALAAFGIANPSATVTAAATGMYYRAGGTGAWTEVTVAEAGAGDFGTAAEAATLSTAATVNAAARAANAAAAAQLNGLMTTGIGGRSNGAISYTTKLSDFTVSLGLVNDKLETQDEDNVVDSQTKVSGQMLSVGYASGPLSGRVTIGTGKATSQSAALGANNFRGATAAIDDTSAKVSDQALLVSYDFGVAQAYFMTESTKGTLTRFRGADIDGTSQSTRASEIGVKVPMGALEPFVTVSRGHVQTVADSDPTSKTKTNAWQVGSKYNMSKRTFAYFGYGSMKAGSNDRALDQGSEKTTGYAAGLVHNF